MLERAGFEVVLDEVDNQNAESHQILLATRVEDIHPQNERSL
jgi:hypothetical protein